MERTITEESEPALESTQVADPSHSTGLSTQSVDDGQVDEAMQLDE